VLDKIEEVEYNTSAFESLLLAAPQKKMIYSLIKIHKDERIQVDDLIKNKGKGMIFLLHGEPGVGKTLTAGGYSSIIREDSFADNSSESVADYTQRPLYTVSSGDLGVDAAAVERTLLDALDLAAAWNAIVLIDEADVFLEQRSNHDLQRNGLVSGRILVSPCGRI
jgi:DNA polymerase III delta prime subunit